MPWVKGIRGTGDFIEVDDNVRFMGTMETMDDNKIGDTYYVRDSGSDSSNGVTPGTAFLTLEHAVHDIAGDWDKIILLPSTDANPYLIEAVSGVDDANIPITITQTGLKIFGGQPSHYMFGSPALHTHTTSTMLVIEGNMVEIGFLSFHDQGAGMSIQLGEGATAWRCYIHDCHFNGNDTATYGIDFGAVLDAPYSVVERCSFIGYVEAGIESAAHFGVIKDCDFQVYTAKYGILHSNTGGTRPGTRLINNRFSTWDGTDAVGIEVTGTPSDGKLFMDGNRFVNFNNAAHCISKGTKKAFNGVNYFGGTLMTVNT